MLTLQEAARLLGVQAQTLGAWVGTETAPPAVLVDGAAMFDLDDVRDWIRALPVTAGGLPVLPGAAHAGHALH